MLKPIFVAKTQSAFLRAKEFLKHPLYPESAKETLLAMRISGLTHNPDPKIIDSRAMEQVNARKCAKIISGFSAATRKKFMDWLDSPAPSPYLKYYVLNQLSLADMSEFTSPAQLNTLDSVVKASISIKDEELAQKTLFHSLARLSLLPEPALKDKTRLKTINNVIFAASEYAPHTLYPLLNLHVHYRGEPAYADKAFAALWHAKLFGGSQNFKRLAEIYSSIHAQELQDAISEQIINTYGRGALTTLTVSLWIKCCLSNPHS